MTVLFCLLTMMTQFAVAEGLLSRFELTQGKLDECPTTLVVTRSQKQILARVIRAPEMMDGAVFQNTMFFSQINLGWQVNESNSVGIFSGNTELLLGSSEATLLREEKLTKAGEVLRHTQKVFKVSDEKKATLQYKIITLKDGVSAQGYSNIQCEYQQSI